MAQFIRLRRGAISVALAPRELQLLLNEVQKRESCPAPDMAHSLAAALRGAGTTISDDDLQRLVDGIGEGGSSGMAVAMSVVMSIAEAGVDSGVGDQKSPELTAEERSSLILALKAAALRKSPRLHQLLEAIESENRPRKG